MVDEFASHSGISWNGHVGTVQYGAGDRGMVVIFYKRPVHSPAKSREAGSPIYEDQTYVKIHPPGERLNIVERAATEQDRRRWPMQWAQFEQNQEQIPEGTPIHLLYPDKPSVAETLKAHGVHTIEQCSELSGTAIDSIGMGAQRYATDAQKYLQIANKGMAASQVRSELEARDREIASLKHTMEMMKVELDRRDQKNGTQVSLEQVQAILSGLQGRPSIPGGQFGSTNLSPQYDAQTAQINAAREPQVKTRKRQRLGS